MSAASSTPKYKKVRKHDFQKKFFGQFLHCYSFGKEIGHGLEGKLPRSECQTLEAPCKVHIFPHEREREREKIRKMSIYIPFLIQRMFL
jgi:hypothetical protein